jgi:nucleotidyltransferase substrate binding protein (TIGR01987 family)
MTINDRYHILLNEFHSALTGLQNALNEDGSTFNPIVKDLIENGRIQKFEICAELAWKLSKFYLEKELGIIESSPKQVYRAVFNASIIEEQLLATLLLIVDDRNALSRIYKEDFFDKVSAELPTHAANLSALYNLLVT